MRVLRFSILAVLITVAVVLWVASADDGVPGIAQSGGEPRNEVVAESRDAGTVSREVVDVAAGGDVVTVRLVDTGGEPIAGAEVVHTVLAVTAEMKNTAAQRLWTRDRAEWAGRFGESLRADAEGVAWIGVPEVPETRATNAMYLCARHAGGFAEDWVLWRDAAGADVTLRLERDVELVLKLVDGQRRPVPGVQLDARFEQDDEIVGLRPATKDLGTTDGDGFLRAPHVQVWWSRVHAPHGLRRVVVGPRVPGHDDDGTEVVLERIPAEPVLVWMPPTGRIVVEVAEWREPQGPFRPRVGLRVAEQDGSESSQAEIDAHGRAVFEHVALGRTWGASLTSTRQVHSFDGPRVDGEEVVFRIEAPTRPILVGRLVIDGLSLGGAEFSLFAAGNRIGYGRVDADARIRVELNPAQIGTTITDLSCSVLDGDAPDLLLGRVAGARELVAGENELGDIVLASVPPIVTGRIVGERDERTQLWCEAADAVGEFLIVRTARVDFDPSGGFTVRGEAPAAQLRLVVFSPKHVPQPPIPFVRGQRDLEIVLERGGAVAADLVLGDQRSFVTLTVRILPADGRTRASLLGLPDGEGEGMHDYDRAVPAMPEFLDTDPETHRYEWCGLPPGRYLVEVGAWGAARPALQIPDVVVTDGERVQLEPVDLRDRVQYVTLRFPDLNRPAVIERGGPFGTIFVDGPGGLAAQCYSIDAAFAFVASSGPVDLVVDVMGFRRQVLRGVREDREVRLEPGLPVELSLAEPPELPEGASLIVRMTAGEGAALPSGAKVMSPAAGGSIPGYSPPAVTCAVEGATLRAAVTAAGSYELSAQVELANGRRVSARIEPSRIAVGESGATATVTVSTDDR